MSVPVAEKTHPFDEATQEGRTPYKVADLSLARQGREEIRLAEQEMPGLMALRREHGAALGSPNLVRVTCSCRPGGGERSVLQGARSALLAWEVESP